MSREHESGIVGRIVSSAAIAFFWALYVPGNAYVNNVQEFPLIRPLSLLAVALGVWIAGTVLLFAAFTLLSRLSKCLHCLSLALLCGVTFAAYVQGNLIKVDYGVLDGRAIPWDQMVLVGVAGVLVWAAIVLGLLGFAWFREKLASEKLWMFAGVFMAYLALVTVLQFLSLKPAQEKPTEFSSRNLMTVSSQRNIVLFVVDSLERSLMDEFLQTHPAYREMLSGFTYYHNTVGKFPNTVRALPQLVTGYDEKEPTDSNTEFKERAFGNSAFFQKIQEAGFVADLYTTPNFAPSLALAEKMGCWGNVVGSESGLREKMNGYIDAVNAAWFTYLPHFLKRHYRACYLGHVGGEDAVALDCRKVESMVCPEGREVVLDIQPTKRLKVYHFWGAHPPEYTVEHVRLAFDRIGRYLAALKRDGLWEKTTVLIMADHGIINRQNPTFLCSNGAGPLTVSEMPVSYGGLGEVLIQALEGGGVSVPRADGERVFFYTRRFDAAGREIKGDPLSIYEGETLSRLEMDGGQTVEGAGKGAFIWTTGKRCRYGIPVPKELVGTNMMVRIDTSAMLGKKQVEQVVRFTLNGQDVEEETWHWPQSMSRSIGLMASSAVNTGRVLWVGMEIRDPVTPQFLEVNPLDNRQLGIRLARFRLIPLPDGDAKGAASFVEECPFEYELVRGFHAPEASGRWNSDTSSCVRIRMPRRLEGQTARAVFTLSPFLAGEKVPRQRMEILSEGVSLLSRTLTAARVQDVEVDIPASCVKRGRVTLEFRIPDTVSPAEAGVSTDPRRLGIFMRAYRLEPSRAPSERSAAPASKVAN